MESPLTAFQASRALSRYPAGSTIRQAAYFPSEYLPCPIKVTVELPDHSQSVVVLRLVRHRMAALPAKAALLPVLHHAGLPVAQVLLAAATGRGSARCTRFCPLYFSAWYKLSDIGRSIRRRLSACDRLCRRCRRKSCQHDRSCHALRLRISCCPKSLCWMSWRACKGKGISGCKMTRVLRAIDRLQRALAAIDTPLVFTNGDYQPANFLVEAGTLTGYVDFEYAAYQDLLYGFVKYPIYDLRPLNRAGIVAHLLEKCGATPADFALRLAVGCLKTLQREISAEMGDSPYGQHIFRLLDDAMRQVGQASSAVNRI